MTGIVVAGVCGGAGTTTVAALIAHALAGDGVRPVDHSGGSLGARLGEIATDDGGDAIEVLDLGAVTTPERWETFARADQVPVLVAPITGNGMALLTDAVALLAAHAPDAMDRLVLVATGTGRADAAWLAIGGETGAARSILPRDRRLAAGGTVTAALETRTIRRAVDDIAGSVRGRLAELSGRSAARR